MKTAEEILIETLNLKTQITEKDYWMTVKVGDCLKAINKALAISSVVGRSEQLKDFLQEVADWDKDYSSTLIKLKAKELLKGF